LIGLKSGNDRPESGALVPLKYRVIAVQNVQICGLPGVNLASSVREQRKVVAGVVSLAGESDTG